MLAHSLQPAPPLRGASCVLRRSGYSAGRVAQVARSLNDQPSNSKGRSRNSSLGKTSLVPWKGGFPKMVLGLKSVSRIVFHSQSLGSQLSTFGFKG